MLHKHIVSGVLACTIGLAAASSANATTFPVGSPNFFITAGTPFSPSITAVFFDTPAAGAFDDSFTFTIPTQSGTGSGSISTSFSGAANQLTISNLFINGVSYPPSNDANGQSRTVGGIAITAGVLNTIRVVGTSLSGAGSYSGTATFLATGAVPDAATWITAIIGFGFVGLALRRRRASVSFA